MRSENEMIAYALEVEPELLPYIPELLADIDELGSDAELITDVIAGLGLEKSALVIDAGCGKGAVALEIAQRLRLAVTGIDLFSPFIDDATQKAASAGLSDLCIFRRADILKYVDTGELFDLAIFAAMGDVLGPLDESMGILRRMVRPGGYIIIHDDYVKEGGSTDFKRWEGYVGRDETIRRLQAHGDKIVREVPEADENLLAEYEQDNNCIRRRAEDLAGRQPELREMLMAFVRDQIDECDFMAENMAPVVWVLKRA